ncbi:MAG TPA: glycosyltransferase family 2 protein [Caldilineaceae bacterium]|nr:glycosyltransferase family 2 protein [Caldilineaceae bacterium]
MEALVSIIIVNWNTCALTADCLRSVAEEHDRLREHFGIVDPIETIVVDNGSTDGSVALLRDQFPWVQLLENQENVGFAAANNQGLSHCHGRYILLLNSDTKLLPGAIEALVCFMEEHPQVGAVGSRYLNPDGSLQHSCYPAPTLSREFWRMFHLDKVYPYGIYRMERWSTEEPRPVDIIQGAALLLRHTIAGKLGLFDTGYFMYSEEQDLCRRIQEAGWQIYYVPRSTIIHYGGQSTRQVAQTMFLQLYRSKVLYFRKHHGRLTTVGYKGVLMAATLMRLLFMPLAWLQGPERRAQTRLLAAHYRRLATSLPRM